MCTHMDTRAYMRVKVVAEERKRRNRSLVTKQGSEKTNDWRNESLLEFVLF